MCTKILCVFFSCFKHTICLRKVETYIQANLWAAIGLHLGPVFLNSFPVTSRLVYSSRDYKRRPNIFTLFLDQAATMSTPLSKPQIITHIQKSLNYTVFDSKWIPCSARFICLGNFARGTGVIQIFEVQRGEIQLIKEVTCPNICLACPCA